MQKNEMLANNRRGDMNIVVIGPVDYGKKTIIGRLIFETASLPDSKLEAVRERCRRYGETFEYSLLPDVLKGEQIKELSTDLSCYTFKSQRCNYHVLAGDDYVDFLRNIITGAVRVEAALIVIDASQGVQENSRRHGNILSLLGIKQTAVLVNKMDLADYQEAVFERIKKDYLEFLAQIKVEPTGVIPVSAIYGDNIATYSDRMFWYQHNTVLETLDLFEEEKPPTKKPFRMPVQGVYRFNRSVDMHRAIVGTTESGLLKAGDDVIFYPSGKASRVKTIENLNSVDQGKIAAGTATGFTIQEGISVGRGEVATIAGQPKMAAASRIKVNIFWLGNEPLFRAKTYTLKIGTAKVEAKVEAINQVIDALTLAKLEKESLDRNEAGQCILKLEGVIAFDTPDVLIETSRFVLIDNYEITGGGLVLEGLPDAHQATRERIFSRNINWERGYIPGNERVERYNQQPTLIIITGKQEMDCKELAKALEKRLFTEGKLVYYYSMDNLLHGINADINATFNEHKEEHFRRLAEVSNIMLDAGVILIFYITELTGEDQQLLQMVYNHENMTTVWVGKEVTTELDYNLHIPRMFSEEKAVDKIKEYLQKTGIIFRPWSSRI